MSVICQTFIQNTWKKDLCSNCFKSLADHRYPNRERNRYILHSATPYHTQHPTWSGTQEWKYLIPNHNASTHGTWTLEKEYIVRDEKRCVTFLEAPDVIGYGGEIYQLDGFADDWESDDGEFNLEKLDETEEDRAITKITKENTRFNTYISEQEVKKQSRYQPVYNRRVTRTDDTYEGNHKTDRRDRNNANRSESLYKTYYLPRVSITPYGTVSNDPPVYTYRNDHEIQTVVKKEGYNTRERIFDNRRDRPKRNSTQDVVLQQYPLVNGDVKSGLLPTSITNSIERIPSFRSDSQTGFADDHLFHEDTEISRIPNKVLEKCKEGINTVSARQIRKNRESIDSLVIDELPTPTDTYPLNECVNTNAIFNGTIDPVSTRDSPPIEEIVNDNIVTQHSPPEIRVEKQMPSDTEDLVEPACKENSDSVIKQNSEIDSNENCVAENQAIIPTAERSLHYAVSAPLSQHSSANNYAESWLAVETSQSNQPIRNSANRESKLAALAVELEQARHYESSQRHEVENTVVTIQAEETRDKKIHRHHKGSSEKETKEESQKSKKSKFSLKKLLKRSKDTDNDGNASSKAWKSGDYDKSTLRLKIVHPMDMIEASGHSTPSPVDNFNIGGGSDSLQDIRNVAEDCEIPHQSNKQESPPLASTSTLNRGKKSERPSKPPPPPKCQRASTKLLDFVDLTIPTKDLFQQNSDVKCQNDENPYDVPRNVITKSDVEKHVNRGGQDSKSDFPSNQNEENQFTPQNLKECEEKMTIKEVTYNVAQFPTKNSQEHRSSFYEEKPELLIPEVKDAPNVVDIPQANNSDEIKKSVPPSEANSANGYKLKAWITLEHSYAVVTAANHEVLAKFLDTAAEERCQQLWKPESTSLQWSDFELTPDSAMRILDDKVVLDATFRHGLRTDVTLLVTNQNLHPVPCGKGESTYPVLGHFVDTFPRNIFSEEQFPMAMDTLLTVHVLQRAELYTFHAYCSSESMSDDIMTERTFIILQLIHLLKVLKNRKIIEVPDLCNAFLTRTDKEEMSKLVLLRDSSSGCNVDNGSLCQFALSAIRKIFCITPQEEVTNGLLNIPSNYRKIFGTVIRLLMQEKSFSLQQTQCFVEYALWGPTTVVQNCKKNLLDMDVTLQRWLDTERAKCLRSVVRTLCRANVVTFLSSYDEYHSSFLLRTSVRSLREVAMKC